MAPARQASAAWPRGQQGPGRQPQAGRDLLGLGEVGLRRRGQVAAIERHDALVALHVGALVHGHGEIALAEQVGLPGLGKGRDPGAVETGIAAQLAGRAR